MSKRAHKRKSLDSFALVPCSAVGASDFHASINDIAHPGPRGRELSLRPERLGAAKRLPIRRVQLTGDFARDAELSFALRSRQEPPADYPLACEETVSPDAEGVCVVPTVSIGKETLDSLRPFTRERGGACQFVLRITVGASAFETEPFCLVWQYSRPAACERLLALEDAEKRLSAEVQRIAEERRLAEERERRLAAERRLAEERESVEREQRLAAELRLESERQRADRAEAEKRLAAEHQAEGEKQMMAALAEREKRMAAEAEYIARENNSLAQRKDAIEANLDCARDVLLTVESLDRLGERKQSFWAVQKMADALVLTLEPFLLQTPPAKIQPESLHRAMCSRLDRMCGFYALYFLWSVHRGGVDWPSLARPSAKRIPAPDFVSRRGYCDWLRGVYELDARIITLEAADFAQIAAGLRADFDPVALCLPVFYQAEQDPSTVPLHAADLPRLGRHLELVREFRAGLRDSLAIALSTKLDQEPTEDGKVDHWIGAWVRRSDSRTIVLAADSYPSLGSAAELLPLLVHYLTVGKRPE